MSEKTKAVSADKICRFLVDAIYPEEHDKYDRERTIAYLDDKAKAKAKNEHYYGSHDWETISIVRSDEYPVDGIEIHISNSGSINLSFEQITKVAEYFDTKNINVKGWGYNPKDTSYGSYQVEILTIWDIKKNIPDRETLDSWPAFEYEKLNDSFGETFRK